MTWFVEIKLRDILCLIFCVLLSLHHQDTVSYYIPWGRTPCPIGGEKNVQHWYPCALTSLYGNTAHCSWHGVAMGCYGLLIVTRTAIVTSQWYDRYCSKEYARMWARHPTTPWQRECTMITDRQSIDSLLDSMRFVTQFWEITPYILRDAIVVLVQSQCYSINARAFGPRTPYRVGGLAGNVMHAWVSHSLVNHWIYNFKASLLSC